MSFPYPISNIPSQLMVGQAGSFVFDHEPAVRINQARMNHLRSLDLNLSGRTVLDVGCGVGHLAQDLARWGCRVTCVDARPANIAELRRRFPRADAHVVNVESEGLNHFGRFDVVFCYGLLYHLENPIAVLRNLATVCQDLLLIETLVCDCDQPILALTDEPNVTWNQSIGAFGCRPSPSWVAMAVNRCGFPYVYAPAHPPEHEDFQFDWRNDLGYSRNGHPMRCIFVASRQLLENPALEPLLISQDCSKQVLPFSPAATEGV